MSNIIKTLFENNGTKIYNDQVYPGHPFMLVGYEYEYLITPYSDFWRIGFRIGKTAQIEFFHPEARYPEAKFRHNYIDIAIAAGRWDGKKWSEPGLIEISKVDFLEPVSQKFNFANYDAQSSFKIKLLYTRSKQELKIVLNFINARALTVKFKIPTEFEFFKPFVWADKKNYKISLETTIKNQIELSSKAAEAFEVGCIRFRYGSIFDSEVLGKPHLLILPTSSNATISSAIQSKASELAIRFPLPMPAGSFKLIERNRPDNLHVAYAYSVDNYDSSSSIIRNICDQILSENNVQQYQTAGIIKINMPLLGTGAGKLPVETVASMYDEIFNGQIHNLEIVVSVNDKHSFKEISKLFTGRSVVVLKKRQKFKPLGISTLERINNIEIPQTAFKLDKRNKIIELNLSQVFVDIQDLIKSCPSIRTLSIIDCSIENSENLPSLKSLSSLSLVGSKLDSYSFISRMSTLKTLDLNFCNLQSIEFISNLSNLENLSIKGNSIKNAHFISELIHLQNLNISSNEITEIAWVTNLTRLKSLNIADNRIKSLPLNVKHKYLEILDLSDNEIENIDFILDLANLKSLRAERNPLSKYLSVVLVDNEDHLHTIKNALYRKNEDGGEIFDKPVKVLLLGNHATGKTSLLNYIIHGNLKKKTETTHVLNIQFYPDGSNNSPKAIFFDFGGQDYYHGIYRAFLTSNAIYLILYNNPFNKNQMRSDIKGIMTQDFKLDYWLEQKKYLETEKFNGETDPLLLVQTRADLDIQSHISNKFNPPLFTNQFFISLNPSPKNDQNKNFSSSLNNYALTYLVESLKTLMDQKKNKQLEPGWYVEFYKYILKQNKASNHTPAIVLSDILRHYKRKNTDAAELLKDDLDQLHKQGIILYYKNEMPDKAWLNPQAFIKYVHQHILTKERVESKGGVIPFKEFDQVDADILNLLRLQKVIFLHEQGETGREYIVPTFLPLANEESSNYTLYTFGLGKPLFTLKFLHFLPFGLINQLISEFGKQDNKKKFWRDQLLFTFQQKAKILIKLDFQLLEIKVSIAYGTDLSAKEKTLLHKYLFYVLMGLYWDFPLLDYDEFKEFANGLINSESTLESLPLHQKLQTCEYIFSKKECQPSDLYISLDTGYFISYKELCDQNDFVRITARLKDETGDLTDSIKSIPIHPFQIFTIKELKRRKKVVISYSKKDLRLVNKFKDYLQPLYADELIETPWYCSELEAGTDWNEEISQRFEQADIIFFMMSENLFATQYVQDYEIKNAIDRWEKDRSVKIIPILLTPYRFERKNPYNLSRFTSLPYTLKAVTLFANQNLAWHTIEESVRIMIERDFDPGIKGEALTTELKKIYEKITSEKIDAEI